jgi:flagellar motor switch/type III secretory pathway protein FliN
MNATATFLRQLAPHQVRLQQSFFRQFAQVRSNDGAWIVSWRAPLSTDSSYSYPYAISLTDAADSRVKLVFSLTQLPYHEKIVAAADCHNPHFIQAACCQILSPVIEALQQFFNLELNARVDFSAIDTTKIRENALHCRICSADGALYSEGSTYFVNADDLCNTLLHTAIYKSPANTGWLNLPCPLYLELGIQSLTRSELNALEPGDAILIHTEASGSSAIKLKIGYQQKFVWRANIIQQQLHVLSKEVFMQNDELNQAPDEYPFAEIDEQILETLDDIPLRITFSLGTCTLTFSEIANIQPGYVMPLPPGFNQCQVYIWANGKKIGYGELVMAGEQVAVQIEKWQPTYESQLT